MTLDLVAATSPKDPIRVACGEFDLADPAVRIYSAVPGTLTRTRLLVRRGRAVLGYLSLDAGPASLDVADVSKTAENAFPQTETTVLPVSDGAVRTMTVALCTRDRPEQLRACLRSLMTVVDPRGFELDILVIDNAPSDRAVGELVAEWSSQHDARVRYLCEPEPGLSYARNAALRAARGEIVAFTDDDVRFSPEWAIELGSAFEAGVGVVTGLVASAQLSQVYDVYFEQRYSSWSSRLEPEIHRPGFRRDDPLFPFASGRFGTGANFAVDRAIALDLGGFDVALGAGSPAGGGEDLDFFARAVLTGSELRYTPAAIVWHNNRTELRGKFLQSFRYGSGCSAYVAKMLFGRRTSARMLRALPLGMRHLLRTATSLRSLEQRLDGRATIRLMLAWELAGYLFGPAAYIVGRARSHAHVRRSP